MYKSKTPGSKPTEATKAPSQKSHKNEMKEENQNGSFGSCLGFIPYLSSRKNLKTVGSCLGFWSDALRFLDQKPSQEEASGAPSAPRFGG